MTVEVSAVGLVGVLLPRQGPVHVTGVEVVSVLGFPNDTVRVVGVEVVTILSPRDAPVVPGPPVTNTARRLMIICS